MNELELLGTVLDALEQQPTREQKIAVLRSWSRGLRGIEPDPGDILMLSDEPNRRIGGQIDKQYGFNQKG